MVRTKHDNLCFHYIYSLPGIEALPLITSVHNKYSKLEKPGKEVCSYS